MEGGQEISVASARFDIRGLKIEVESCADPVGTWRARVIEPAHMRGGWSRGNRAWQAIDAASRGVDEYEEPPAA
jgi:hypothetical protein